MGLLYLSISVVILCGSDEFVRDFMLLAHQLDMTNGEYVYVVVDQVPSKHVFTPWVAGDDQDDTARLAFESVLQVLVFIPRLYKSEMSYI